MLDYAVLLTATIISCVSAYYSINGLTALFAAAPIPIIVMGTALEVGKVLTTVWLRHNWDIVGSFMKLVLTASVIILMLITSLGTFGFLSKAHLDQAAPSAQLQAEVILLDEQIQTERDNIAANKLVLSQMDNSVTEILTRSQDERGAERAVQLRRGQREERATLLRENELANKRIQSLLARRAPLAHKVRNVEAEVGPVRYLTALFYGHSPGPEILEKAVRWVIVAIVAVFDPLALALMLAVNRKLKSNDHQTAEERFRSIGVTPDRLA